MDAAEAASQLVGERASPELIESAAHHAAHSEIDPTSDIHASVAFKRHLAVVLTRRALETAFSRAEAAR